MMKQAQHCEHRPLLTRCLHRKPFEAGNIQELRMRVMSGRFHPLPDSCCPDLKQVGFCRLSE